MGDSNTKAHIRGIQKNTVADPAGGGRDHRLHRRRGAVHHEKSVIRAERGGGEFLRVFYHGDLMTEIVQRLHGIHVEFHAKLAEIPGKFRIHPATFMCRHVKMRQTVYPLRVQCLCERQSILFKIQFMQLLSRFFPQGRSFQSCTRAERVTYYGTNERDCTTYIPSSQCQFALKCRVQKTSNIQIPERKVLLFVIVV